MDDDASIDRSSSIAKLRKKTLPALSCTNTRKSYAATLLLRLPPTTAEQSKGWVAFRVCMCVCVFCQSVYLSLFFFVGCCCCVCIWLVQYTRSPLCLHPSCIVTWSPSTSACACVCVSVCAVIRVETCMYVCVFWIHKIVYVVCVYSVRVLFWSCIPEWPSSFPLPLPLTVQCAFPSPFSCPSPSSLCFSVCF